MPQRDLGLTPARTDLEFHASGFIVKVQGLWTDTALHEFGQFLRVRGLLPSDH